MNIRLLTLALLLSLAGAPLHAQAPVPIAPSAPVATPAPPAVPEPPLVWHDVTKWGVEGRAWGDLERQGWFDRFPAEAKGKVTDAVWNLSRQSAGMMVRFKTDSTTIWCDYVLRAEKVALTNMTAIGASGLDLYTRDDKGQWRWVGVSKPAGKTVKQAIISGLAPGWREYVLYLPLYNGLESLSLGVAPGAKFEELAPRIAKPIVFYGTSITQGASASRTGMVHTAIIGRHLELPVLNLGFSGNGRMDAAVGEMMAKVDAAVYVIDCLPNMQPADVRQKCQPLVQQLKAAHPETPIVLVEDRRSANAWIMPDRQTFHDQNHAALRESFEALQKAGVTKLFYLPGDALIGEDSEGTTDGSHPNDLGFMRQAAVFEPVLREALAASK